MTDAEESEELRWPRHWEVSRWRGRSHRMLLVISLLFVVVGPVMVIVTPGAVWWFAVIWVLVTGVGAWQTWRRATAVTLDRDGTVEFSQAVLLDSDVPVYDLVTALRANNAALEVRW